MAVPADLPADGDGAIRVALAELVALGRRIGRLHLPQAASRAMRSGQQVSHLYGRGMDYAESRAYQAGDDVRRLDWRLTARSGTLHTKLFQEEREGRLLVLLDTHASMHFGTRARFKSVQAARACAAAAWLAIGAGERVGLAAFGTRNDLLRPQAGPRGALALCGALAAWDAAPRPPHSEPLSQALRRLRQLRQHANHLLLVSDGFSVDDDAGAALAALRRGTDMGVLVIADALEHDDPPAGRFPLEHAGERREMTLVGEGQRREFRQRMGAGVQRLQALASAAGARCRVLDTRDDPVDAVVAALGATRSRR
ncbi:MAG: DUF58 domain-containing protein [Rhodanobacter sp.]|nr:MAG: DUF58 domain-containing protein [Rhodanobacter sp.]TAM15195.1 MAG: DUF58 domain-containing protein [Rhodanobacter sp.]TAM36655.1 MAG: DUF58 domain-containing protein [Rhodanobacter sp.]